MSKKFTKTMDNKTMILILTTISLYAAIVILKGNLNKKENVEEEQDIVERAKGSGGVSMYEDDVVAGNTIHSVEPPKQTYDEYREEKKKKEEEQQNNLSPQPAPAPAPTPTPYTK